MGISITSWTALWFLPFVLPICLWVSWSDLKAMKIPNKAVITLAGIFLVVGLVALPLEEMPWRILTMVVTLVLMFVANLIGLMGAGDSKFIAAAVPFIDPGDVSLVTFLFAATLLACFVTHRLAKFTGLRQFAPEWASWDRGRKFPMGFPLSMTLVVYLVLGVGFGA